MIKRIQAGLVGWLDNPVWRGRVIGLGGAVLFMLTQPQVAAAADANMSEAIANLAKLLIDGIIALAAILLAVGIATNFVTGMVETMVGRPGGLSTTWMRIAGIVMCFVGAIFTITITNTIIDTLKTYKSTGGITLP